MIPIHETGTQKGRINQTILQTNKPKGTFKLGDPHPKTEFKSCYYIKWCSNPKKASNYEVWGCKNKVKKTKETAHKAHMRKKANSKVWGAKLKADAEYREKNKQRLKEHYKQFYIDNRDKIKAKSKAYREANKSKVNEKEAKRRERDREKLNAYFRDRHHKLKNDIDYIIKRKQSALKRKDKKVIEDKRWAKANRKKIREYHRQRMKNPNHRLRQVLSGRILQAVKNQSSDKAYKSMELLGCTIQELREHLESQFTEGMTWEKMGRGGWHIDHIIPCAFFDLSKPSHQKVCFNWQNLQPLWESDNCAKGDKIPWYVLLTILMNNYKTITL
jgi:hypothetical protein